MNGTIRFGEMLDMMDRFDENGNPVPFSLVFASANRTQQTGGEIHIVGKDNKFLLELKKRIKGSVYTDSDAIKCVGKDKNKNVIIDRRNSGDTPKVNKNPNHFKNSTRNIMIVSSKAIRKVHIRLILYFNGKKVIP